MEKRAFSCEGLCDALFIAMSLVKAGSGCVLHPTVLPLLGKAAVDGALSAAAREADKQSAAAASVQQQQQQQRGSSKRPVPELTKTQVKGFMTAVLADGEPFLNEPFYACPNRSRTCVPLYFLFGTRRQPSLAFRGSRPTSAAGCQGVRVRDTGNARCPSRPSAGAFWPAVSRGCGDGTAQPWGVGQRLHFTDPPFGAPRISRVATTDPTVSVCFRVC